MALDISNASIGLDKGGIKKVKDDIELNLIDESIKVIKNDVEALKNNIPNYWVGAAGKAFALKCESERSKVSTILKVLKAKVEIDLGTMAANTVLADAEVATAIWAMSGGGGSSTGSPSGGGNTPAPAPTIPDPSNSPQNLEEDPTSTPEKDNQEAEDIDVDGTPTVPAEEAPKEPTVGEPPLEPTVGEPPVAEPTVGEPPLEEPTVGEPPIAEPTVGEPPIAEPTVGEPPLEEPTVGEPPLEEPTVGEPPLPTIDGSAGEDTPTVPAEEAPKDNNDTDKPIVPGEEPPAEGQQDTDSPVVNPGESTAQIEQEKGEQQLAEDNKPESSLVPGEEEPKDTDDTNKPTVPGEEAPTDSQTPVVNPGEATAQTEQEKGQQQPETQEEKPQVQPGSELAAYEEEKGRQHAEEVAAQQAAASAERQTATMSAAESWLDTPYLYGGEGKNGIDCSSFVQHVAASVGVDLPRTTDTQIKCGSSISRDDLKPGDLIFTNNGDHVVIYAGIVDGVPSTIGASSTGGRVKYVPLEYHSGIIDYRRIPGMN